MFNFKKSAFLAAALSIALSTQTSAEVFKGETAGVGDPVHTM